MSISEMRNTTTGKVVGFLAALALVMSLVFGATYAPVKAQTVEELQEQIAELLELVAALQAATEGTPVSGDFDYVFLNDLGMGSTGTDVMMLQTYLNMNSATQVATTGVGAPGMETSYYGSLTANAVSRYQELNAASVLTPLGLASGTGYFGPSTRAHMNGEIAVGVDDDDDDDDDTSGGDLSGGEGFITVEDLSVGAVDIDLGDEEIVYEFSVEAEDADVEVNRVDVRFDLRPWLYFDEVRLWADGEEIAVLDGSGDFSESGNEWRARFTGLDIVVEEGETVDFAVQVEVLASMGGTRDLDTVVVYLPQDGVRAVDGAGIIQYGPDADLDDVDVTFDDTFGGGSLDVALATDSPDEDSLILTEVDEDTDDQVLAIFEVEADGDSDVTVTGADFQINVGAGDADDLVRRLRLYADGDLLDTATTTAAGVVEFDGFDYVVDEDDMVEFTLEADFHPVATQNTIEVVLEDLYAEDEDFVDVSWTTDIDTEDIPVASIALVTTLESKSVSTTEVGTTTTGTALFEIEVTAVGQDFWIEADGTSFDTSVSNADTSVTNFEITVVGESEDGNGNYRLREGQTYTIEVEVIVSADADAGVEVTKVELVDFDSDNDSNGDADADNTHELGAPDYESASIQVFTSNP